MHGVPIGFNANGNIHPMRFVKLDSTVTGGKVLESGVGNGTEGDLSIGISAQWQHTLPWYPLQDGYIATAGMNCAVYTQGMVCLLSIAGTVSTGQPLKPTTDGKGIAATTDKDRYGAIAMESGITGQDIKVLVVGYGERSV